MVPTVFQWMSPAVRPWDHRGEQWEGLRLVFLLQCPVGGQHLRWAWVVPTQPASCGPGQQARTTHTVMCAEAGAVLTVPSTGLLPKTALLATLGCSQVQMIRNLLKRPGGTWKHSLVVPL